MADTFNPVLLWRRSDLKTHVFIHLTTDICQPASLCDAIKASTNHLFYYLSVFLTISLMTRFKSVKQQHVRVATG